jgi:hypothetical protein
MAVGAVGPWENLNFVSYGGLDGSGDGWLVLALAGLAEAVLLRVVLHGSSLRIAAVCSAVAAGLATADSLYNLIVLPGHAVIEIDVSPGWGVEVALLASAALFGVSLRLLFVSPVGPSSAGWPSRLT